MWCSALCAVDHFWKRLRVFSCVPFWKRLRLFLRFACCIAVGVCMYLRRTILVAATLSAADHFSTAFDYFLDLWFWKLLCEMLGWH